MTIHQHSLALSAIIMHSFHCLLLVLVLVCTGCSGIGIKDHPKRRQHVVVAAQQMSTMVPMYNATVPMNGTEMSTMPSMFNMTTVDPMYNATVPMNGTDMPPVFNMTTVDPLFNVTVPMNGTEMTTTTFPFNMTMPSNFTAMPSTTPYPSFNMTTSTSWNFTTMSPPAPCTGLVFLQEMTTFINATQKNDFFNLSGMVLAAVQNQSMYPMSYSFSQFGAAIYTPLAMDNATTTQMTLKKAWYKYNMTQKPLGMSVYTGAALQQVLQLTSTNYSRGGLNVLLAAESGNIRDIHKAFAEATNIAKMPINVYVIDYSTGPVPMSIWPTLTGNKMYHILNGNSMDVHEIYEFLLSTLVYDIQSGQCY